MKYGMTEFYAAIQTKKKKKKKNVNTQLKFISEISFAKYNDQDRMYTTTTNNTILPKVNTDRIRVSQTQHTTIPVLIS